MLFRSLKNYVKTLASKRASNGAVVIMHPENGEILALAGSVDWNNPTAGKINMATSPRQPGSTFKPIVYATAFSKNLLTPSSILIDAPQTFGKKYRPVNYDGRYRGPITVRRALANSLNIPAVETLSRVGIPSVIELAEQMGVTTISDTAQNNLSIALGSEAVSLIDLTNVYSTFANYGVNTGKKMITNIYDKYGTPLQIDSHKPKRAVSAEVSFLISSILSDNDSRKAVFGDILVLSKEAAAKTGTTQDFKDAWTVGYTPDFTVGVWIGNSDNTPMQNLPGALGAAPLWRTLMEHMLANQPSQLFSPPPRIVSANICRTRGHSSATGEGYGHKEFYIKGTEPTRYCAPTQPPPSPDETSPEDTPNQDNKPPKKDEVAARPQKSATNTNQPQEKTKVATKDND